MLKLNLQRFAGAIPYDITVNGEKFSIERSRDDIATTWEIDQSVNSDKYSISNNKVVWNDGTILQYNNVDVLPTDEIINGAYTTRTNTPTYSFKHWYANNTKIGTGTYKFKHFSIIEPTPLPQLDSPDNLKVTNNILTFGAVENATSYEIFVDDVSIGAYVVPSGFKYVLNSSGITAPTNTIDETINFSNLVGDLFTRIQIESEGKGTHISYFNGTTETNVISGATGVTGDNATITFETEPTGDLLTWLNANATRESD